MEKIGNLIQCTHCDKRNILIIQNADNLRDIRIDDTIPDDITPMFLLGEKDIGEIFVCKECVARNANLTKYISKMKGAASLAKGFNVMGALNVITMAGLYNSNNMTGLMIGASAASLNCAGYYLASKKQGWYLERIKGNIWNSL